MRISNHISAELPFDPEVKLVADLRTVFTVRDRVIPVVN
jgi:hypothetical protein